MKKIYILCGGTMVHVTPHFSLTAPAYGNVGQQLATSIEAEIRKSVQTEQYEVCLLPTKMALGCLTDELYTRYQFILEQLNCGLTSIETNDDLERLIDCLIERKDTRSIILAAAVCDFEPEMLYGLKDFGQGLEVENEVNKFGKNSSRLDSAKKYELLLKPAPKLVQKIRQKRKDVFVVSFKTTAGVGRDETYRKGLLSLKKNSSNLVFANDIQDKINMVITPEEFPYESDSRDGALKLLAEITWKRINLTFGDVTTIKDSQRAFPDKLMEEKAIPANWYEVMQYLFANEAFKPLPGTGKTSGHFGCMVDSYSGHDYERITSERKINHNESFQRGMIPVYSYKDGNLIVGGAKPSVGEKTQEMIYQELGDKVSSIVHFHCPLKHETRVIPQREQFPYECGSLECAMNTSTGMKEIEPGIYAVHLINHGPNIAFNHEVSSEKVIQFINQWWELKEKTGGIIHEVSKSIDLIKKI